MDGNGMNVTLGSGETTFGAVLTKTTMTFNDQTSMWEIGSTEIIDSISETYTTIPAPDQSLMQSLMQSLVNVICSAFPNFGICTA